MSNSRARKKAQTRQLISDMATGLFLAHGFDQVTVADVARAANVSVNTVFNYFRTKEDLFFDRQEEAEGLLGRIVATRNAVLPLPIKGGKLWLYNNNPLFYTRYPGVDGVKTGYTNASGPCLVAAARRGRAWLGVVLLHSADLIDQAQRLLNAGFGKVKGT